MLNEILGIIATILAVTGVICNNRKMVACFYFWLLSNGLSGVIHFNCGIYSLLARDIVFWVLAIEGLIKWRRGK
jgi:nicotinamide riboside transporter PnuC